MAISKAKWEASQIILNEKTQLMEQCFELCRKLTQDAYSHPARQLKDMIKIGDLAREAEGMWKAANTVTGVK